MSAVILEMFATRIQTDAKNDMYVYTEHRRLIKVMMIMGEHSQDLYLHVHWMQSRKSYGEGYSPDGKVVNLPDSKILMWKKMSPV